jgi:hypothetical protein
MARNPKFASIGLIEVGEELAHLRETQPERRHGLVGRWFHTFDEDGRVEKQGTIIDEISDKVYLVQLFEWILGEPSIQELIPLDEMTGWAFYGSGEDMQFAYSQRREGF